VGNMSAFRALRTLRALRPLKAVARWEGMRVSRYSIDSTEVFMPLLFRAQINTDYLFIQFLEHITHIRGTCIVLIHATRLHVTRDNSTILEKK